MACCDIWETFDEKDYLLKEYNHWKLLLRNRNTTLGNCVAITKRHMGEFSEITPEEMQEFAQVVKDVERSLKAAFNYEKINYQMLMMKDKHTHFHILPRYSTDKYFAGVIWKDEGWPGLPVSRKEEVKKEILEEVKKEILKHLKK
jgi:diadenosine tetraphosphate (Ap4A) HIT family hydrolase